MAPIKFEENIKNKLENRALKPSSLAWDKLSNRLDEQEKNKNSKLFWWLGIAASIVGVVFVTSQFFNSNTNILNDSIIVDNEIKIQDKPQVDNVIVDNKLEGETLVNEKFQENKASNLTQMGKEKTEKVDKKIGHKTVEHIYENKKVIAKTNFENKVTSEKHIENKLSNLSKEDNKILSVVAEIKSMEAHENSVSDEDIEGLLKQAQKEILIQNVYNDSTKTVDANALLQDVEDDLDESFRTKVFEALKSSYKSVKTAVAQRNN